MNRRILSSIPYRISGGISEGRNPSRNIIDEILDLIIGGIHLGYSGGFSPKNPGILENISGRESGGIPRPTQITLTAD